MSTEFSVTAPAAFTPMLAHQFLANLDHYRSNITAYAHNGRDDAVALIEGYLEEFADLGRDKLVTAGES